MKCFILMILGTMLTAGTSMAKELEPAIRVGFKTELNDKSKNKKYFCSGSVVKKDDKLYLSTAYHCLGSSQFVAMLDGYFQYFKVKATRGKDLGPGDGISFFMDAKSRFSGDVNFLFLDVFYRLSRQSLERDKYMAELESDLNNRFSRVLKDGMLIELDTDEQTLKERKIPVLELGSNSDLAIGNRVSYSGITGGKFSSGDCTIVDISEVKESISNNCSENALETLGILSENKSDNIVLSCDGFDRHPGGLSGGPIRLEGTNTLIGVASSAPVDFESLKKMRKHNPYGLWGISEQDFLDTKQCYPFVSNYLFVAPMTQELFNEREMGYEVL